MVLLLRLHYLLSETREIVQQHQFNLGIDSAKFLFHPMAHISPNVTHQPLPYHEVSAARLLTATSDGLQGAGIPIEALGLRDTGNMF